jgi:DNA-binding transcriptional regulator YhcF (GntR family)
MEWKFRSDLPIYSQLVEQIKLGIVSAKLLPGERLMSVRDMATEAGVNPNTMQRALQELERDGMVYSQRTAGRFVTENMQVIERAKKKFAEEQIRSFLEAMKKLGYQWEEILALLKEKEEEEENGDS